MVDGYQKVNIMELYCGDDDIQKIKDNKIHFVQNLIGLNIPYGVCGKISSAMNAVIIEIEDANKEQNDG